MPSYTQSELEKMLKGNPDMHLLLPRQMGKTRLAKAVQSEIPLVTEKLYQELFEFKEMHLSESQTQMNFVTWLRDNKKYYNQLASGFSVPNGGKRPKKTAITMKKEGIEPGVSDYMILHPAKTFAGLVIEFKVKYNKPTDAQKEWLNRLSINGFYCAVCWSQKDAQKLVVWFYDLPKGLY